MQIIGHSCEWVKLSKSLCINVSLMVHDSDLHKCSIATVKQHDKLIILWFDDVSNIYTTSIDSPH